MNSGMTFVLGLLAWMAISIASALIVSRVILVANDADDLGSIRRFERGREVLRPKGGSR